MPTESIPTLDTTAKAYPFDTLARERVVHDEIGGQAIVVFWTPGTASALDNRVIATAKDVGATGVFITKVGDRELTFQSTDDGFTDDETGSRWNIFGKAIAGPLAGEQLEPVIHANHFWFAWGGLQPRHAHPRWLRRSIISGPR